MFLGYSMLFLIEIWEEKHRNLEEKLIKMGKFIWMKLYRQFAWKKRFFYFKNLKELIMDVYKIKFNNLKGFPC